MLQPCPNCNSHEDLGLDIKDGEEILSCLGCNIEVPIIFNGQ